MRKMLVALFALLLLAAPLLAQENTYTRQGQKASLLWEGAGWAGLAVMAVALSFTTLSLIYVLAHALSFDSVKRWVVGEASHTLASAMIIGSLIVLLNLALPYASKLTSQFQDIECSGSAGYIEDPISYAQCKVQSKITLLDKMFAAVYNANKGVEAAAATCYSLVNIQFYCGDWHLRPKVEMAHLLGAKITPLLVNLHGQYVLLEYIRNNMLSVFLPLGVLLRTFAPTRGLGGLFIAVAIGFYIVFPVLLVIGDFANMNVYVNVNEPDSLLRKCYISFRGSAAILNDAMGGLGGNADMVYAQTAAQIAQLTVGILLYPFIAFAATLIFITNVAGVLGGDAAMITRMAQRVIV